MRTQRILALADLLAESEYDVVALQELWVESQDWRSLRELCASQFAYGKFFLT